MFKETHPVLGTRDVRRAIEFYIQQLAFKLALKDQTDAPNYVGFRCRVVELHMQFQFKHELGTIRLRLMAEDSDALLNKYRQYGVVCIPNSALYTPSGRASSRTA